MKTGLDRVAESPHLLKNLGRIGIVTNQAVTTQKYMPAAEAIFQAARKTEGASVTCVFGPQHGYFQTEQDNMRETPHGQFHFSNTESVPLLSLYSDTRIPTADQLQIVDTLVIDMVDIGCRIYTYMLTLAGCLKAASEHGKNVVVLDRPNPLGLCSREPGSKTWSKVEGDVLDLRWHSFVGWYAIPMRHGLSMGELGRYFISIDKLNLEYSVIEVEGLTRATPVLTFAGMPWAMPSPNIPTWASAFFFPSFVALEGTNVSEGRGTTLPFQIVGAPFFKSAEWISQLKSLQLDAFGSRPHNTALGVLARPHDFTPTFNKHAGHICHGVQMHVTDPSFPNLFALGMHFLYFCAAAHGDAFDWKEPGYEYNYTDSPIHLILGTEIWKGFFDKARNSGKNQMNDEALDSLLHGSFASAQRFAQEASFAHIYK